MPSVTALRKCPDLVFVKPRFDVYKSVSREIRAIFSEHASLVEPLSLDEAYLDVTENLTGAPSATRIAEEIRAKIFARTGLTASAGVSYNKFLAKLASDHKKPDGLFVVPPARGEAFVEPLPVARLHGVGPATEARMKRLGIETVADLKALPLGLLQERFGKAGAYYYGIARAIDERPVRPDRIRKSLGTESTFFEDLHGFEAMRLALLPILDKLWRQAQALGVSGRTVTLKAKTADFRIFSRSRSRSEPVPERAALEAESLALLRPLLTEAASPLRRGVRLLGVTLGALSGPDLRPAPRQLDLGLS